MYVCVCRAVTDREVEAAIDEGADTVEAVTRACCAGQDCGACHTTVEEMIAARWGERPATGARLPVVPSRPAPNRAA
ncbi:MAG: (2Fe-2S)-binding protein [Myxococcales bacterium]|nr:(2Fe-2S)-binding protein [Myxococcales bacterium]